MRCHRSAQGARRSRSQAARSLRAPPPRSPAPVPERLEPLERLERLERLDREGGFALPATVLLLALFTGLAMAGAMLASQQVRSASDMRASIMAFHAAEGGAAWVAGGLAAGRLDWMDGDSLSGAGLHEVSADIPAFRPAVPNHGSAAWWVDFVAFDGDEATFRILGEVLATGVRRAVRVTLSRGDDSSSSPFASAVVACDGVTLSGSGRIDSWDSNLGPYHPSIAQSNANVGTLSSSGDVVLSGSSPIRGDVIAARDIRVTGSAQVQGDYRAVRNLVLTGNPSCPAGAVEVGGVVIPPGAWWLNGCGNPVFDEGVDLQFNPAPCDPMGAAQMVSDSMAAHRPPAGDFQAWTHTGWRPNPIVIEEDQAYHSFSIGPGAHPVVIDTGAVDFLFVDGNFSLTSSSVLRLMNPSVLGAPQHLKLFVNGNLSAAGASRLEIDPGVSLSIYVTGSVTFTGGHSQVLDATVNLGSAADPQVVPTLGLYSSFAGANGVRLNGNAPLSAVIYAPLTSVEVSGSGALYGAVWGRTVSVSGGSSIHYDEALGLVGGTAGSEGGAPRILSWEEVVP